MKQKLENQEIQKLPKKKRGRPPKKKLQQNQDTSSKIETKKQTPNFEESLSQSPIIKSISQGLVEVSQSIVGLQEKITQSVEQRVNQTEEKVGKLAEAISAVTQLITSQAQSSNNPQTQNLPAPANPNTNTQLPQLAGTQDKLAYWTSLLARLAELGKPPAPIQTSSNTEEGLSKGFNLMMGVITKLMEVQSGFRKNFLEEIRDTFTIFPKALKGERIVKKKSKEKEHLEE